MDLQKIDKIVDKYANTKKNRTPSLIPILQEIQDEFGWLPEAAFKRASERLEIPMVKLYGVATFYNEFRLKPLGEHHITICMGTACHVRGADVILEEFERELGIQDGGVTPDRQFSLETAMCIGCCAVAPVIMADGEYHGKMTKQDVKPLIDELSQKKKVKNDG